MFYSARARGGGVDMEGRREQQQTRRRRENYCCIVTGDEYMRGNRLAAITRAGG